MHTGTVVGIITIVMIVGLITWLVIDTASLTALIYAIIPAGMTTEAFIALAVAAFGTVGLVLLASDL